VRPGLWPVRAEVWFDWIFVNLDGTAPALQKAIAPIVERMGGYDFNGCVYGGELTYDVKTNWKLAHENYLDVLHKFKIHPELEKAAPLRTNTPYAWVGDTAVVSHTLESPTDGRGGTLPPLPGVPEEVRRLGVAAHFFPNANFMYWRDQAVLLVCDAVTPERTIEHFFIYFAEEAMQTQYGKAREQVFATWDHLNRQDIAPLEWMQEGRRAAHFDGGSFSPYWDPQIVEYLNRLKAATL
jgi:choline monooxygenase